jgi:hypothetical protein
MPRIQIELTSTRPDGTWTWRVAGAREPRGVVDAELIPAGAKVGDVLRAEAEVELEGTTVTSVVAAPAKRQEPERLELIGKPEPFEAVTTSLLPKGARPRRSTWDGGGEARGSRSGPGTGRPGGATGRPAGSGAGRPGGGPPGAGRAAERDDARRGPRYGGPRRDPDAAAGEAATAGQPAPQERSGPRERPGPNDRPPRSGETRRPDGRGPEDRGPEHRPSGDRRPTGGLPGARGQMGRARPARPPAGRGAPDRTETREPTAAPRAKRLNPANVHRAAVLADLAPEHVPVAEQLLHGGIPAVRRALQDQNAKLRAEGQPEITTDAILTLAEGLLPRLKGAEWRDRAEAAVADIDELALRDLRSVVAGADAARDDDTRLLAKTLRDALDRRESKERQAWLDEIGRCLDDGRLVRALRVSGRPPDPRTRFPADLATRLSGAAGAGLAADALPDRWITVLEAVIESPIHRSVKPAGLPTDPAGAVVGAARQASGRVPALAAMLGIDMPPPPGPLRGGLRGGRAGSSSASRRTPGSARPIPPPPTSSARRPPVPAQQTPGPAPEAARPAIELPPAPPAPPAAPGPAPEAARPAIELPPAPAAPPVALPPIPAAPPPAPVAPPVNALSVPGPPTAPPVAVSRPATADGSSAADDDAVQATAPDLEGAAES